MGKSVGTLPVAGGVIFEHRTGGLGIADHSHAQPGVIRIFAFWRGSITFTGQSVGAAADREFFALRGRAGCRAIFPSLGQPSHPGDNYLGLKRVDQPIVSVGSIIYYLYACLIFSIRWFRSLHCTKRNAVQV